METPRASSMFRKAVGLVVELRRRFAGAVSLLLAGKGASAPSPVPAPDFPRGLAPSPSGEGRRLGRVSAAPRPFPRPAFALLDALARRPVEGKRYSLDRVACEWAREFADVRPARRPYVLFNNPVVRSVSDLAQPGRVVDVESLAFALALCRHAGVEPADLGLGERAVRRQLDFLETAAREEWAIVVRGDDRRALAQLLEKYDRSLAAEKSLR